MILSGLVKDSVYQIQEQEQAVLTTFGVPKAVPETGLHFKLPLVQKIQKVNTTIQDSEPPTQEVMKAFKAVETAKQGKETALNNANKYRNEKLPEAQAQADQIVQDAQAQKQVRINEAEAEVARFNAMYEEYVKNPQTTKIRMFYETMEEVLPEMKIIIDNGDGVQKILPVDSFAAENTLDTDTQNTDTEK